MGIDEKGPQDIFDDTMATAITRDVKELHILEEAGATFSILTFLHPSGEAQAIANAAGVTVSSNMIIRHVKSFKVTAGSVLAVFYGAPSPAPQ